MCRKLILSFFILLFLTDAASATQFAYQVNFTDKNGTLTFSDSLTFLSSRSMARRNNLGIVLDSTDLPVTRQYVDSVLHLTGGKFHSVSRWFNFCVILVNDSTQIHALTGKTFISSVKLVGYYTGTLHKPARKTNPIESKTTAGSVFYGLTWPQTSIVNGNYLHDLGYKGQGKIIAVVDGGFTASNTHRGFDSMRTSGRLVDVHNFVRDSTWVYDYDNHGTEVLSTMAGYIPDTFVGSAPLASYALYVTEDAGEQPIELLNMVCGAERADSLGADIISSSLGYNQFDDPIYDYVFATDFDGKTTIAARGANMATRKGILFVTSAGNEGNSSWHRILTPGDADSALTIGNVDITGVNPTNSGFGPNAAGQIKPDVCGMGQNAAVFSSTDFSSTSGTSLSTPEIAGFAACLWQAAPHSTPAQIRQAIRQCASLYTTPGDQIGYGIPNFQCAAQALNIVDTPTPDNGQLLTLSPNPAGNTIVLTLSLAVSGMVDFKIIDVTGRTILSFSDRFLQGANSPVSYNINRLPAGIYLLKANTGNQQQVIRFVRN